MSGLPITYRGVVYPWQCDHMEETGEVSAISEMTAVHLDTVRRKSCPFPGQVVERARQAVVSSSPGARK